MVSFILRAAVYQRSRVSLQREASALFIQACDGFQVRLTETPPRLPRELEIAPKQFPNKIATAPHYESNCTKIFTRSKPRLVHLVHCGNLARRLHAIRLWQGDPPICRAAAPRFHS